MKRHILFPLLFFIIPELISQTITNHLMLGKAKISSQEYQDALHHFQTAIEMEPNHAEAYYMRGWVRYILGEFELGGMDFRKAAELNPAFVKRQQKARRPMADLDEGNTKISQLKIPDSNK